MSQQEPPKKRQLTDQERLDLITKLDKDLDQYLESLPKRPQENIPFDQIEEDITNHPLFLKETPQPGDKVHPLFEALQKLKYDPDENEPEDLAISYKDDGNFSFKHKKYRLAIISYTEGLRIKCGNSDIDANLYNNRSAAHYFLGNYRSALRDCEAALKVKPNYDKVLTRAANCCYKTEKYDKAIEYCDQILDKNETDKEIQELRKKCVQDAKLKERNQRKNELAQKKIEKEEEMIVNAILERGIKIAGGNLSLARLEPQFPELFSSRVTVNEDNHLVWPVVLFYPEYKIMDYIQQFDETNTFMEQLEMVFECPPEWDDEKKYKPNDLNVYFENEKRKNVKINVNKTLFDILKMDGLAIQDGTPRFIVLVANSRVEKQFLSMS